MNNNEVKIGMSPFNWFLSIVGILILLSFIVLPPVFRLVFPKPEEEAPFVDTIVIKTLKCSVNNRLVEEHVENDIITFKYYQDQMRSYSRTKENVYTDIESFDTDRQKYGRLSTAYSILEGVEYDASPDNVNLTISIKEKYDFGLFSPRTVSIPGEEETIDLDSEYKLGESVDKIKNNLIELGYTCEDITPEN